MPHGLTAPTWRYVGSVVVVFLALALFLASYFGLMLGGIAVFGWAMLVCPEEGAWWYVKLGALGMTPIVLLPFFFLVMNVHGRRRPRRDHAIEISPADEPRLFAFIAGVCDEVGVPRPAQVCVDHRVNAHVRPVGSSLFRRGEYRLVIGLGAVNSINLTEFKAMLAHEFAHTSQGATRLGALASRVLEIWLHLNEQQIAMSRWPSVLAWPALLIRAELWCVCQLMGGVGLLVARSHLALKRRMEYHADLVAARVAGSEGMIQLLHASEYGQASLNQTLDDLEMAMESDLFTNDLFVHQSVAAEQRRRENPTASRQPSPASLEDAALLADDSRAEKWADHPSTADRERNLRAHFITSEQDERSPWLLFDNAQRLRERVTYNVYRHYFRTNPDVPIPGAEAVQNFIDGERADHVYDSRYHGLYDDRDLYLSDVTELARLTGKQSSTIVGLTVLYDAEVQERAQLVHQRRKDRDLLLAIVNGWHRPRDATLRFRGANYHRKDAAPLLANVEDEVKSDERWLAEHDRRVFVTYYQLAVQLDPNCARELEDRYAFTVSVQELQAELRRRHGPVQSALAYLNTQLVNRFDDHADVLDSLRAVRNAMQSILSAAELMPLPPLRNLPAGRPLRPFLLKEKLIDEWCIPDERWIAGLLDQFNEMRGKLERIRCKSVAGILALQEKIEAA